MNIKLLPILAFGILGILPASGAITVNTVSAGDGYHHNELGTASDFFNSTSASLSARYYFYYTSDTLQYDIGYAQFSLATVPVSTILDSAYLYVYLESRHYADESPSAGFINHVANSSSANGSASQKLAGSERVVEIKDQSVGWLQLDVTTMIQNDLDNGYTYSAFSFNPNTSGYVRDASFRLTSADAAENGMYLSLTLIPEPSVCILLVGSLVLVRRHRVS